MRTLGRHGYRSPPSDSQAVADRGLTPVVAAISRSDVRPSPGTVTVPMTRASDPLGDHLRRAARLHGHAERQSAASIVRFWWLTIEQLRLVAELGDQAEEAVEVDVVEGGLDLVHHVERRRPAAEHGEQERQRGQRLRSPPDSSDSFLTFLPLGLASTSMPVFEQVVGIGEHERADAAREQRRRTAA